MNRMMVLLGLCTACTDVKSSAIKTDGMNAQFSAVSDGTGTAASATIRVGGELSNTFVELEEGDSIEVTDGAESMVLQHQGFGAFHEYGAFFQQSAAGTAFTFSLNRADGDNAPTSTAVLPDTFSITEPGTGQNFSRSDEILVEWSGAGTGDRMQFEVTGDCIGGYVETKDGDDGSHVIPAGELDSFEEGESCQATLVVERIRSGQLDPAFGSGSVYGAQRRTVDFRSDP